MVDHIIFTAVLTGIIALSYGFCFGRALEKNSVVARPQPPLPTLVEADEGR